MSQLPSVCPDCGIVFERMSNAARCPDCVGTSSVPGAGKTEYNYLRGSSSAQGYDYQWRKLSERARRMSPQCEDCGSPYDLTADHSVTAWERKAEGKVIRLQDIAVVCRRCNAERGAARGPRASEHQRWERRLPNIEFDPDPGE